MKHLSKLLAALVAAAVLMTALSVSAFAESPKRIRISPSKKTLRVDKTVDLEVYYTPDDADEDLEITWSSTNSNVAIVDDHGTVTAVGSGQCEIKAKTENGKTFRCVITVPGKVSDEDRDSVEKELDDGYLPTVRLSGKLDAATLKKNVQLASGDKITLRNQGSVDAKALQEASRTMTYRFATRSGDRTVAQLTLTPEVVSRLSGEIKTGISCGTRDLKTAQTSLERHFTNNVKMVRVLQGRFPAPVRYAFDTNGLQTKNIHIYSYNKEDGKYSLLNVTSTVDQNGYLHFSTSQGGYFILSEGPLQKK